MNDPTGIKAFYMRANDDSRTVAAMDVLAPAIGGIIGGSQHLGHFPEKWSPVFRLKMRPLRSKEQLAVLDARMTSAASTRSTTLGTAACAATARRRTPAWRNERGSTENSIISRCVNVWCKTSMPVP
jgi:hypothetical protein